eukprot:jgi/Psemu1/303444/fgenesh1_kg.105_\
MRNSTSSHRSIISKEDRISIETVLTFSSLPIEDIFNGDELVDVFQGNMNTIDDQSTLSCETISFVPDKRDSGNSFDGRELMKALQEVQSGSLVKGNKMQTKSQLITEKTFLERNDSDTNSDNEDEDMIEYIDKIRPYDIICGRNNGAHNCVGNRRFRITIMMNLRRYMDAPNREDKSYVIKSVIDLLLNEEEVGARFIKRVGENMYVRLKDRQIREKVGHAFRDMIALSDKEAKKVERNLNFRSNGFR